MKFKVDNIGNIVEWELGNLSGKLTNAKDAVLEVEEKEPEDFLSKAPFYQYVDGNFQLDEDAYEDSLNDDGESGIGIDERLDAIESAVFEILEVLLDG